MQNICKLPTVIVLSFLKNALKFEFLHSQMKNTLYSNDSRLTKLIEKLLHY